MYYKNTIENKTGAVTDANLLKEIDPDHKISFRGH